MIKNWLTEDNRIHLPKLFLHMGYRLDSEEKTHHVYKGLGTTYVVIYTDKGFVYYTTKRPQEKLSASDLIIQHVSKTEGQDKELLWDKVHNYYVAVLASESLVMANQTKVEMATVPYNFNHFNDYASALPLNKVGLYADIENSLPFSGRILQNETGEVLFPLFNIQNEVCGYFKDTDAGVVPSKNSAVKHSLWYSNIPKSIDGLFLFKDPKEALAFHLKFKLKNIVYLALGDINAQTTKILFQIQRLTKVDKLYLSFTGDKKIEGYLRDLHFLSFAEDSAFKLNLTDRDILLQFPMDNEKSFSKFYEHTRRFNKDLSESFLKYNKVIDQNVLNKYSIMLSKDGEDIKVRLPLETDAIKLFVWSYYKNYLNKKIEILKPTTENWVSEWELTRGQAKKGKEVHLKEFRIAI